MEIFQQEVSFFQKCDNILHNVYINLINVYLEYQGVPIIHDA